MPQAPASRSKETSAALIYGNEIVHCAHGIMADSPMDPINRIVFINNIIAHNVTGIYFYGAKGGHIAINNTFKSNLWPVTIIGDGDPMNDFWWGNSWDNYEGFDLDGDGLGDKPWLYAWADRIWMETPSATFFRSTPVLELLDFLERLAPFSSLADPARHGAAPGNRGPVQSSQSRMSSIRSSTAPSDN